MLHCHVLEHEDEGLMAYVHVQGKEGTVVDLGSNASCYRSASEVGFALTEDGSQQVIPAFPGDTSLVPIAIAGTVAASLLAIASYGYSAKGQAQRLCTTNLCRK